MFYLIPRNQNRNKHESMIDPNLGWGGGVVLPSPSWFSLNNRETVKTEIKTKMNN